MRLETMFFNFLFLMTYSLTHFNVLFCTLTVIGPLVYVCTPADDHLLSHDSLHVKQMIRIHGRLKEFKIFQQPQFFCFNILLINTFVSKYLIFFQIP